MARRPLAKEVFHTRIAKANSITAPLIGNHHSALFGCYRYHHNHANQCRLESIEGIS